MIDGFFRLLAAIINAIAAKWQRDEAVKPHREIEIEDTQKAATEGNEQDVQSTFWGWRNSRGNDRRRKP